MLRGAVSLVVLLGTALVAAAQPAPLLPDLADTEVTLTWQDFRRLIEAARPLPTPAPAPPQAAILRSAEYAGRLEPGVLTLDAVLRVEVLADGWIRLPLWGQGSVVRFAGDGAVLNRSGGRLEVIANGRRSYELRARLVFDAPVSPGENRLALELPDAPVNLVDVALAPGLRDLEVESGLAYRAQADRVYAAVVGGKLTMSYAVPYRAVESDAGDEVTLAPRVLVTAYQFLDLGDGVISGILIHDYQVRVAGVSLFDVALEDGVEVFDASAPGLESWKVLQRDGGRVLRLRLASPVEGAARIVVTFDGSYDSATGRLAVPRFEPVDVEREAGFVVVAAEGAEVELELGGNVLPADVAELPADVVAYGGNLVAAAKYAGAPDRVAVTVTEHADAAVLTAIVERLSASTVLLANGTEATWLDLVIKSNRKQFLELGVPAEGVEVWSLLVDGQPARPKRSGDRVLVPLPTASGERTSQVALVLLRHGGEMPALGTVRPSLPGLDAPVSETMWTVYLPSGRRYRPVPGPFRVVGVSAPLLADARGGIGLGRVMSPTASILEEAKDYVSDELVAKQKAQGAEISQQVMARQGASRRGSLPVRISLPGGVGSLPTVTVTRILMVGDDRSVLAIRVYPGWLRASLRAIQALLIVAAGLLAALLASRRFDRRHLRWAAIATAGALIPIGGIGVLAAVWWMVVVFAVAWLTLAVVRWRARRRGTTDDGSDHTPGEPA